MCEGAVSKAEHHNHINQTSCPAGVRRLPDLPDFHYPVPSARLRTCSIYRNFRCELTRRLTAITLFCYQSRSAPSFTCNLPSFFSPFTLTSPAAPALLPPAAHAERSPFDSPQPLHQYAPLGSKLSSSSSSSNRLPRCDGETRPQAFSFHLPLSFNFWRQARNALRRD